MPGTIKEFADQVRSALATVEPPASITLSGLAEALGTTATLGALYIPGTNIMVREFAKGLHFSAAGDYRYNGVTLTGAEVRAILPGLVRLSRTAQAIDSEFEAAIRGFERRVTELVHDTTVQAALKQLEIHDKIGFSSNPDQQGVVVL